MLQARIPEKLDEELRERAEQLGLSVSTVVRNVLLNTFDLVEGVVTDTAQLARAFGKQESPVAPISTPNSGVSVLPDESAVIGWQEAILNMNGVCENCNAILPKGKSAAFGIPATARPSFLCLACLACLAQLSPKQNQHQQEPPEKNIPAAPNVKLTRGQKKPSS